MELSFFTSLALRHTEPCGQPHGAGPGSPWRTRSAQAYSTHVYLIILDRRIRPTRPTPSEPSKTAAGAGMAAVVALRNDDVPGGERNGQRSPVPGVRPHD